MRRYSFPLSFAAILLALLVTYTYVHRSARDRQHPSNPVRPIDPGVQATAKAWHWGKDDPQTNCPVVRAVATSFRAIHEPATFELTDMRLRLFNKGCSKYTYVQSARAEFDESSGVMVSKDNVSILMDVPADKEPEDKQATAKLVHVRTSGVRYETKNGKVDTDQPAWFQFANGSGQSVGADYDPNTHQLHMKSKILLDWLGAGPPENAMHIEAGELRYEENNNKIYLWPWSRLRRNGTVINAANSEVTLNDGVLQQVDSLQAIGTDDEKARHVEYGADKLVALFNDNGDMTQITAAPNAHLASVDPSTKTAVTGQQAVLKFDIQTETVNGQERNSSILHESYASGHAVIESSPIARPGVKPADTRILRSEAIGILMKPGGREIASLRTDGPGQLEFKPNQPDRAHRWMDGDRIEVVYGAENSVEALHATKASTRTEKPLVAAKQKSNGAAQTPPPPALTWSDELTAGFAPLTNELTTLEQKGNFRYEEGVRHATSATAFLEQAANKITLSQDARVWDDTGTTSADTIVLNQQNGDMNADGRVASTRQPDQQKDQQKSSLLNQTQPLQARSDKMITHDNNLKIRYDGHAVLWQGANRIQADSVDIDRDEETLHAAGHVISQLVDSQSDDSGKQSTRLPAGGDQVHLQEVVDKAPVAPAADKARKKKPGPVLFTIVRAPDLLYRDDDRVAHYTGGVSLVRDKMTVTSKEIRAFLTESSDDQDNGTSLDHAFADGDVKVVDTTSGRTRTGTSDHCEYYPKQNKVILNGGLAKMADTRKGTTIGQQLTYFSDTDHIIVEGSPKKPVQSEMDRHK